MTSFPQQCKTIKINQLNMDLSFHQNKYRDKLKTVSHSKPFKPCMSKMLPVHFNTLEFTCR